MIVYAVSVTEFRHKGITQGKPSIIFRRSPKLAFCEVTRQLKSFTEVHIGMLRRNSSGEAEVIINIKTPDDSIEKSEAPCQ